MNFLSKIVLASTLLVCSFAQAEPIYGPEFREELMKVLQPAIVEKVIAESNRAGSPLRKIIAKHDIPDGRNSEGTINLPLKPNDFQVTMVSGDSYYQCRGSKNSDAVSCDSSLTGVFLVTIASYAGVHRGSVWEGVTVVVTAGLFVTTDGNTDTETSRSIEVTIEKELKLGLGGM